MATLTQLGFYTRKLIKYGIFLIIILLVGRFVLNITISLWRKIVPPSLPPPTVTFDKLPAIKFPEKEKIEGLTFKLETPTGTLPKFPDRANVYFMPYLRPNLLALDRAKQQASLMGFTTEPKAISEKTYQWTKKDSFKLEMDIFSGAFVYSYDWQNDQTILSEKSLPGKEGAKQEAKSFLQRTRVLEEDLSKGRIEVNYFKLSERKLVLAVSPSEANFARVELFRKDIDQLPVFTADPAKGIVNVLISGAREYEKRIVKVESNYFPIKYDSSGTYPLKTSTVAWQELEAGQAFIARWKEPEKQVVIRRIYLAYFDSTEPQKFLQPIIVFEGDNSFFAYVSAITGEWSL